MRLNAKQIMAYTAGEFIVEPMDASALISGLTWDSRTCKFGDVYVALPGQRVDGHDFIADALRLGAQAVLVSMPVSASVQLLAKEMGAAIIEVANTYTAITDLARAWRGFLRGRVIGVTGSTGKTTTKNLIRDVLIACFDVTATVANQNNELGVPATLLAANPETQMVVVEMGMRGQGEIAALCDFVKPDWGVLVNVGTSHIELLGSRENIACAKAELLEALPPTVGKAFLCASDDYVDFVREHANLDGRGICTVLFGEQTPGSNVRASSANQRPSLSVYPRDLVLDEQGRPCFTLCFDNAETGTLVQLACTLNLRGLHNVSNACAAAAIGWQAGMNPELIVAALERALPEAGRQEIIQAQRGFTLINDAYNANPESMEASLRTFAAMAVSGKRYAVLGDMAELGEYALPCHRAIGTLIATLGIDCIVCVGELGHEIAHAARDAGMSAERIICAQGISECLGELDTLLSPGDAVLAKASHVMGLSRVIEGLAK